MLDFLTNFPLPLATMVYYGIATAVVTLVSAGISYAGSQASAKAQEQAGEAQQDAAAAAAHNEELQTAENIKRERINKDRRLARLRASLGAGGLVMDGSSMDVFAETAGSEELAIQDIARDGSLNSTNLRNEGNMSAWESRALARATRVSSYGTLLSGVSTAATQGASAWKNRPPTTPKTSASTTTAVR